MENFTDDPKNFANMSNQLYCQLYNQQQNRTPLQEEEWTKSQVIWTFMFSLILVIAIVGNSIVLWIILAHRSMWSVTNYFLFNLTLADLMMATLNCIPSFIFMRDRVWNLGYVYCKVNTFLSYVTVPASVFTLLAITVDRRKAIVHPLKPKTSRVRVLSTISLIWIFSSLMALPPTIVTRHFQPGRCSKKYLCVPIWDETESDDHSKYDHVYNVIFTVVTYITPMLGMGGCYVQIGRNLWGGEIIGEIMVHPAVLKSRKNKKRVVIMFAIVISIFMVCWLPYQLYFLFLYYLPNLKQFKYIGDVYLSFYWLAMANSCVNPIIYYWMNSRFREYFNSVLFCLPRYLRRVTTNSMKYRIERGNSPAPNIIRFKHLNGERFENNIPVRALGLVEHDQAEEGKVRGLRPTTVSEGIQDRSKGSGGHQKTVILAEVVPAVEILF